MYKRPVSVLLAQPKTKYQEKPPKPLWVEVLVDFQEGHNLYIYRLASGLVVKPGDIVSVPFGNQVKGGIAIRYLESLPSTLDPSQVKDIEDVIAQGFFPAEFWQLLNRLALYYCSPLISVIRLTLPPGLLTKSQSRVRLKPEALPPGAETFCTHAGQQILQLLRAQKVGDYSVKYLQRQVRGAQRGIKELRKRGWVESYIEAPKPTRPKQQKAVTLVVEAMPSDVTPRQREMLEVLRRQGGEMWLSELLQACNASSSIITALEAKGYVVVQQREVLRLLAAPPTVAEAAKILNQAQEEALGAINSLSGFAQVLLHGVTGSGKTEVYLQGIAPILQQGKSALVLVPEISLTPQLTDRFRARFGNKVCVYHSKLSSGERYDTWRQMLTGEPQVVIGARSAVFAPLPKLGIIILDEEHDSSFKQNQPAPTYHARTVARWRAELGNFPLILGSATPALETWVMFQEAGSREKGSGDAGEDLAINYPQSTINHQPSTHYLSLPERIQSRPLPPVEIVDLRRELQQGNRSIFSRSLQNALQQMYQQGRQGILFIPRRGHSTFVSCRSCGYVIECPHCDVSLSYHHTHEGARELLRCHYCNHTQAQPRNCPECDSPYLKFFGSGTQRVVRELNKVFPQLRIIRFDSDTTRAKGAHRRLLTSFANHEADLLVGTQMLTKGIDVAQVTLVGVVAADGLLHRSDYRAAERAFQTLTQVAGRAGRGQDSGKVIVQTYSPQHPVIQAVQRHDYQAFISAELDQREALEYPPYGKLILLRLSSGDGAQVQATAESLAQACENLVGSDGEILGPAPATIMRVNRRYRWQILLKFPATMELDLPDVSVLRDLCPQSVSLMIDVDPLSID